MDVFDVGGDGAEGTDEGGPVVAVAGSGDDVGDEVGGEDEVTEGTDDDAARPGRGVGVHQAVVEGEGGEDGFFAQNGGGAAELDPEVGCGIPALGAEFDGELGVHGGRLNPKSSTLNSK